MSPESVLIVCTGNICRSPTAEVVLRQALEREGLEIRVDSAATTAYHCGQRPDSRAIQHAARRGYDLTGLKARQIQPTDFETFDLILVADRSHLGALKAICPTVHQHKIALFLGDTSIPDPYYGGAEGFEEVLDMIEERVEELVRQWRSS